MSVVGGIFFIILMIKKRRVGIWKLN
jgi:hypothetical protein